MKLIIEKGYSMRDTAYSERKIRQNIKLIQLVFHSFNGDKKYKCFNFPDNHYDTLSLIDSYMHSEVRYRMDEGDDITHDYGNKQVYNRVDKSNCLEKTKDYSIEILRWMATVYCTLQWKKCIHSSCISDNIPAVTLYSLYDKMKNLSIDDVCEQLFNNYLSDKELSLTSGKYIICEDFEYEEDK